LLFGTKKIDKLNVPFPRFQLNVLKSPNCFFWTTNFILLIVLCWTTVFRTYLYTKQNDRKKITTQYFFSLASQTKNNFYTFITTQPFVCNTLIIIRILRIYLNILYRCEEEAKNWKMCFFFKLEQYTVKSVHCCRCFRDFFMWMHMWVV
jgi:hypothetical protein